MPLTKSPATTTCRVLALAVFLGGIAILGFVFVTALHLFRAPVHDLPLPVAPGATPPPAMNIGIALTAFARQLLWLALITVVGSLMAEKGIRLYFSAPGAFAEAHQPPPAVKNGHAPAAGLATASERRVSDPSQN